MDLATLIGVVSGLALMLGAIIMEGGVGALPTFWSASSVVIVLGGTIAAILVNFPLKQVVAVWPLLKVAFSEKKSDASDVIATLVEFAEISRREGLLALEEKAQSLDEEFLKKGIQLVVDGTDAELVRSILEIELDFIEERHESGQQIFEQMGGLAPAFGMLGTLIGLIQMLTELDDPDSIGSGMAVALITTLYGAGLANLIFLPIAGKLKIKSAQEILMKQVMIEGILSIQAGENPRIVEEKLKAFLSPVQRTVERRVDSGEGVTKGA